MSRYFFTFFLMFTLFVTNAQDLIERTQLGIAPVDNNYSQAINGLATNLEQRKQLASSRNAKNYSLFKAGNKNQLLPAKVEKGVVLNFQKEVLNEIRREANPLLTLSIPVNESASFELDLYQIKIHATGFEISTSAPVDQVVKRTGIFYHGILKGNPNSAVAVSIYEDLIDIFIQDNQGNYKIEKSIASEDYLLYNGHHRTNKKKFACGTNGSKFRSASLPEQRNNHNRSSAAAEVPIYLEVDYALYTAKNRNINTATRFIEMMITEVTALYGRLDIPIKISQLKIHTTPDRYPKSGEIDGEKLSAFGENVKSNFTGKLAHLLSGETGGGIANLDVLCATYEKDGVNGPYGLSGIGYPEEQTPDLDDINTFAHELGHNFGSHHTQACFWNGNNTAIDGCVESESLEDEEPTCTRPNTDCPAGGGTIMSYCSTPDAPLFDCVANNNWHPQVATYIKSKYAEAIEKGCISGQASSPDRDGDGFAADVDCNDNNSAINPDAREICNGIDDNCDGNIDEGLTVSTYYQDSDRDGFGNPNVSLSRCQQPSGYVSNNTDCNDNNASINPNASEIPNNNIDENCDGQDVTSFVDNDNDGYNSSQDCNDNNARINPGAREICNGIDDNCDGNIDEGLAVSTYYQDLDRDGFGNPNMSLSDCQQPSGYVSNNTDCNDSNARINPNASEIINNGMDDNCDGTIDEGNDTPVTGSCAPITGNLTTSSIGDNNAYIYTPQPNGAVNNQFRYRPIGSNTWEVTDISTNYYRYLNGLLAGTKYEFQVNQACGDGTYSEFSAASFFTTTGETQGGGNTGNGDGNGGNTGGGSDNSGTCAPIASTLTTSSIGDNNAYIYTSQPNGAINNQFRYRPLGSSTWEVTDISTNYYRYLSGLFSGNLYEFQVSQACGDGTYSEFSAAAFFTTTGEKQDGGNTGNGDGSTGGNNDGNTGGNNDGGTQENSDCASVTADRLYVSSVISSAAYAYTPQPNGATNNQFRYRMLGTTDWTETTITTSYYRYLTGLSASTTYEYQVRQECSAGVWSSYSGSYEFNTTASSKSLSSAGPMAYAAFQQLSTSRTSLRMQIAPNPVAHELLFQLDQPVAVGAVLRIYDINGQLAQEIPLQQGLFQTTIKVSNLQSGIYFLEYRAANLLKTDKFIKR